MWTMRSVFTHRQNGSVVVNGKKCQLFDLNLKKFIDLPFTLLFASKCYIHFMRYYAKRVLRRLSANSSHRLRQD